MLYAAEYKLISERIEKRAANVRKTLLYSAVSEIDR